MTKILSPAAIVALKEALCQVYWYKNQMQGFVRQCLSNPAVLATLNWSDPKRQIASDLVDYLARDQAKYLGDLTRLCHEICSISSFPHLEQLEDGAQKAARARSAVAQLRTLLQPHEVTLKEERSAQERERRSAEKASAQTALRQKLEQIKTRYQILAISSQAQGRGFELERVMYDLFELYDLDPKASFRNTGEQIDGAFSMEGTDYLFEAKWEKQLVGAAALDTFAAKVRRKLENTLGLFLSISGFSPDGVTAHASSGAVILLMDGADLMAVLEERISLAALLLRKKRHAAQTGNIYLRFADLPG
jgi:hypothetical protein